MTSYLQQRKAFLHQLLLLIYLTGGQSARETELLALQWKNGDNGTRRNIFLENELVSFVTFYHKGYSVLSSIKIIHWYLSREVSELAVYYLWLIEPGCRQLERLTLHTVHIDPVLLWSTCDGLTERSWASERLSEVIQDRFTRGLRTTANILIWRHAAIAVSRKHMSERGFKRDYRQKTADDVINAQAGHTTAVAGQIYARGIHETSDYVASVKAEYRQISRQWHACLGFDRCLELRPKLIQKDLTSAIDSAQYSRSSSPARDVRSSDKSMLEKRRRESMKKDIEKWVREELQWRRLIKRLRVSKIKSAV